MIEGFLFPDRTGSVKQPVDAMRRGSFQALQNIHKRKLPTILVPQRQEEKMDMVGHDYDCIEMYSCGAGEAKTLDGLRSLRERRGRASLDRTADGYPDRKSVV